MQVSLKRGCGQEPMKDLGFHNIRMTCQANEKPAKQKSLGWEAGAVGSSPECPVPE